MRTFVRLAMRVVGTLLGVWGFGVLMTPVWNFLLSPTGARWADPAGGLQSGLPPFAIGVVLWIWTILDERVAARGQN